MESARTARPLNAAPCRVEGLQIYVIFTEYARTGYALEAASLMAEDLGATLTLLAAQVVPYPLPLEDPPVAPEFSERRLAAMAGRQSPAAEVRLLFCRDRGDTIRKALAPRSLVVIGEAGPWRSREERGLARLLRRDGHEVILLRMSRPVAGWTAAAAQGGRR